MGTGQKKLRSLNKKIMAYENFLLDLSHGMGWDTSSGPMEKFFHPIRSPAVKYMIIHNTHCFHMILKIKYWF
jgi:hypothetical protein